MWPRHVVALLLLGAWSAVGPLANGSPPDSTWIGGVYDAGDYDDAVIAITAMEAAQGHGPSAVLAPREVILGVIPIARATATPIALPTASIRAPPIL